MKRCTPWGWAVVGLAILTGAGCTCSTGRPGSEAAADGSSSRGTLPPGHVEVLRYYLDVQPEGERPERSTGVEPLDPSASFQLHFVANEPGYLYIVAPEGRANAPAALLTAQPAQITGVGTNHLASGEDVAVPARDVRLGVTDGETRFTVLFSATPLSEPRFLAGPAQRRLTAGEVRELADLRRRHETTAPALTAQASSEPPTVVVSVSDENAKRGVVIFDIPIATRGGRP
jgi:hypothetical protein